MDEQQILSIVQENPLAKGVTFSGGEPFAQAEGFCTLAKLLKEHGYEVASYSGYTFEELMNGSTAQQQLLQQLDVLIDGPYPARTSQPFAGVSGQQQPEEFWMFLPVFPLDLQ